MIPFVFYLQKKPNFVVDISKAHWNLQPASANEHWNFDFIRKCSQNQTKLLKNNIVISCQPSQHKNAQKNFQANWHKAESLASNPNLFVNYVLQTNSERSHEIKRVHEEANKGAYQRRGRALCCCGQVTGLSCCHCGDGSVTVSTMTTSQIGRSSCQSGAVQKTRRSRQE